MGFNYRVCSFFVRFFFCCLFCFLMTDVPIIFTWIMLQWKDAATPKSTQSPFFYCIVLENDKMTVLVKTKKANQFISSKVLMKKKNLIAITADCIEERSHSDWPLTRGIKSLWRITCSNHVSIPFSPSLNRHHLPGVECNGNHRFKKKKAGGESVTH